MRELLLTPEAVLQEEHAADLCQRARRSFAKKLTSFLFFLLIPRCKPLTSGLEQVNPLLQWQETHCQAGSAPKATSSKEGDGSIMAEGRCFVGFLLVPQGMRSGADHGTAAWKDFAEASSGQPTRSERDKAKSPAEVDHAH